MNAGDGWIVRLEESHEPQRLGEAWRALQRRAACSFFQSWGWIGPWLEAAPARRQPLVLRVAHGQCTAGLALLGRGRRSRRPLAPVRTLLVSETGDADYDALTVEHNGFLVERGREREIIVRALRFLLAAAVPWDELVLGGAEDRVSRMYTEAAAAAGLSPRVCEAHPYFFVDLARLRGGERDYLATVPGPNTRHQVRRALRAYASRGTVALRVAATVTEALEYLARLRELHQRRWRARGQPGAFAHPRAWEFHERLVRAGLTRGEVQLVCVRAGRAPLGYLYNFVFDGVVYNYQGGFAYEDDARLKPGLVAHALTIGHNAALGHRRYDFLMGEQRYKRSLADGEGVMQRVSLRRPRLGLRLETGLASAWRRLAS